MGCGLAVNLPRRDGVECEACGGTGFFYPALPNCRVTESAEVAVVERCDQCEQFEDDLEAAMKKVDWRARFVTCCHGGLHVVVPLD